LGHQLTQFFIHYGALAILLVTLVKGVGIPIPIPADLVILFAATESASGRLALWAAFGAVFIGMVVGGIIQFRLMRGPARAILYRFGSKVGLTPHRLDLATQRVENVGVFGVAAAVVTPAIRTAAIPACGIVKVPGKIFVTGLAAGSGVYIAVQFFVVYGLTKLALSFWSQENKALLWLALIPLVCVLASAVYWHRTRHLPKLHGELQEEDEDLRSARCPLCRFTAVVDTLSHRDKGSRSVGQQRSHATTDA
jgi:membrane protein DedA with SNARE-associated domain